MQGILKCRKWSYWMSTFSRYWSWSLLLCRTWKLKRSCVWPGAGRQWTACIQWVHQSTSGHGKLAHHAGRHTERLAGSRHRTDNITWLLSVADKYINSNETFRIYYDISHHSGDHHCVLAAQLLVSVCLYVIISYKLLLMTLLSWNKLDFGGNLVKGFWVSRSIFFLHSEVLANAMLLDSNFIFIVHVIGLIVA